MYIHVEAHTMTSLRIICHLSFSSVITEGNMITIGTARYISGGRGEGAVYSPLEIGLKLYIFM